MMKLKKRNVLAYFLCFIYCAWAEASREPELPYTAPIRQDAESYRRCKITHRCNMAKTEYNVSSASLKHTVQVFEGGKEFPANAFFDFEDWKAGTLGWTLDTGVEIYPPLKTTQSFEIEELGNSLGNLFLNDPHVQVRIDTDEALLEVQITGDPNISTLQQPQTSSQLAGVHKTTADNVTMAVFLFDSFFVGPLTQVGLNGSFPLALYSLSSSVLDTPIDIPPEALGGKPGVRNITEALRPDVENGTAILHVQQYTVSIEDRITHEVQRIDATIANGQTLRGTFRVSFLDRLSVPLKVDVSAAEMKHRLEQLHPYIGEVGVTRSGVSVAIGFTWKITFLSRLGDQPQLLVDDSSLTDPRTSVVASTETNGKIIEGNWMLTKHNKVIGEFPVSVSSKSLEENLEMALAPYSLSSAQVSRSSFNTERPLSCFTTFCLNNPQANFHNISYTITLSWETWSSDYLKDGVANPVVSAPLSAVEIEFNSSTAFLNVTEGHFFVEEPELGVGLSPHPLYKMEEYFLGYGGTGGTNAGRGGFGHAFHASVPSPAFNSTRLSGGAGGCLGGEIPQQILPFLRMGEPPGYGGSGGGVIELFAINDITIGINGSISTNGANGSPAYRGGGGGAGGSVRLITGGTVRLDAAVTASGGAGGDGMGMNGKGGGGGGGGFLGIVAQTVSMGTRNLINVKGGLKGVDGITSANISAEEGNNKNDRLPLPINRTDSDQGGAHGLLQQFTGANMAFSLDAFNGGAADTPRSLRIDVDEEVTSDGDASVPTLKLFNGPMFKFQNQTEMRKFSSKESSGGDVTPDRVSVFVKSGRPKRGSILTYNGFHVALLGNNSNVQEFLGTDGEILIGLAIINGKWVIGSNYRGLPVESINSTNSNSVVNHPIEIGRWYKLDFFISWENQTFMMRIDDESVVAGIPFSGAKLQHVGLFLFDAGTAWFDELYAGPEFTMGFECPLTKFADGEQNYIRRPIQSRWRQTDLAPDPLYGTESQLDNITRHSNHLSNREKFTHPWRDGLIFGDGQPHKWYDSQVQRSTSAEDKAIEHGEVSIGALHFVPGDTVSTEIHRSALSLSKNLGLSSERGAGAGDSSLTNVLEPGERAKELTRDAADAEKRFQGQDPILDGYGEDWNGKSGRWYWYGEHDNFLADENLNGVPIYLAGGIGACSTNDFITWRNEGIQLYFTNITDNVYGDSTTPDKAMTEIHEAFGIIEKYRMDYANSLSPYWNKTQSSRGEHLDLEILRTEQGAIWDPRSNVLIPAEFDTVFNLTAFPNSRIRCPNATVVRSHSGGPEHHRYMDTIQTLCDNDVDSIVRPALQEETEKRSRAVNGKHSFDVPNLCYFLVTVNHSMLGFNSPEEIKEAKNGVFVNNTLYYVSNGTVVISEDSHQSFESIVTQFFFRNGRFWINGTFDQSRNQYMGGNELKITCPAIKRFFYRAERPKVIYNPSNKEWVMWMQVDDTYQQRRLAGVAKSKWPSGPFTFIHSFLPDGNETVDFTVMSTFRNRLSTSSNCNKTGEYYSEAESRCAQTISYMARTYYATKAYMMPLPIMQPVWESVKDRDGVIDFTLNFHRALYAAGYDNPDDIYRQRWRMEDRPWNIHVKEWEETFDASENEFVLHNTKSGETLYYKAEDRAEVLGEELDGETLADITGQGQNLILSKFVNPQNLTNSDWIPDSVPAVKAQPWHRNYVDKNIADNPVHPTVADLLIGPLRPVLYRRTKYVAISKLNEDYSNTNGILRIIEGELLENQQLDILHSLDSQSPFGWEPGENETSTFPAHVIADEHVFNFTTKVDWYDRHHQYSAFYGDRQDDFRNFRDRFLNTTCREIHHYAMRKQNECEIILNTQLQYEFSPPQLNYKLENKSFARGMDTETYEVCLAEHKDLLLKYEQCVHNLVPEIFFDGTWVPNDRECVGGGGRCGPPKEGEDPQKDYKVNEEFTFDREYTSMTNVYGAGGPPLVEANLAELRELGESTFEDNAENREILEEYRKYIASVKRPADREDGYE